MICIVCIFQIDIPAIVQSVAVQVSTSTGTQTEATNNRADKETQTEWVGRDVILAMQETIHRNEKLINSNSTRVAWAAEKPSEPSQKSETDTMLGAFSFEQCKKSESHFHFYTGLTVAQFLHLFSALGTAVNNLIYYKGKNSRNETKKT